MNNYFNANFYPAYTQPLFPRDFRISLTYYVRSGDTLYKIGSLYGISVGDLINANNLTSTVIIPGQALIIPNFTLPTGVYATGSSGEPIRRIQLALYAMGHNIAVDGYYGLNTANIIRSIQKKYPEALTADGVYGPLTRSYLEILIAKKYRIIQNPANLLVLVNKRNSLSYDYIPANLIVPNIPFSFQGYDPRKLMRGEAAKALELLFTQASRENIRLTGVSAYRSFDRQAEIFKSNIATNPNANLTSARPGESEHQTGLSIDVSSPSVNNSLVQSLGNTREGQWLAKNAPTFGFIIRFPKGKEAITGYAYEPWHIRYVGQSTARQIAAGNLTLEEYLR
jgi:LAS superfamily LD-carboxypeptidase LdcB